MSSCAQKVDLGLCDECRELTCQAVLAGKFIFPEVTKPKVSSLAKDLISRLLNVDPKARLSPQEILWHPFVTLHLDTPHILTPLPEKLMSSLQHILSEY